MEKRHQVFISSTYNDLLEERSAVMHALLSLNCIPAGMELFAASDAQQWELIHKTIEESDYYIVIIGDKYGTIPDGDELSYTHREYLYAIERKIPVLGFVHGNPNQLAKERVELDESKRQKLEEFKGLVKSKLCMFWHTSEELSSQVIVSLVKEQQRNPRTGWIRANAFGGLKAEDIIELQKENEQLQKKKKELEQQIIHNLSFTDEDLNNSIEIVATRSSTATSNIPAEISNSLTLRDILILLAPDFSKSEFLDQSRARRKIAWLVAIRAGVDLRSESSNSPYFLESSCAERLRIFLWSFRLIETQKGRNGSHWRLSDKGKDIIYSLVKNKYVTRS